jgi:hypothetical protein
MYTHRTMWKGIELLARGKGWSLPKLAMLAGLDPTALNPSKRISREGKPRWPSTETVVKLLAATDVTFAEFCGFIEAESQKAVAPTNEILFVDEGLGLCRAAAGSLQRMGHAVRIVSGSRAALDLLDRARPLPLLCTELSLPDGLDDADRLQHLLNDRWPDLEIVHLGTYPHADSHAMKLLLGGPGRHSAIHALAGILHKVDA